MFKLMLHLKVPSKAEGVVGRVVLDEGLVVESVWLMLPFCSVIIVDPEVFKSG